MVSLPVDILDLFADELVHDFEVSNCKYDRVPMLTLRSYALVSRRNLVRCQKALFAKILLGYKTRFMYDECELRTPAKLARLLQNSPHLSTYIRKLKVSGIMMSDISYDLSSILRATSNLCAFSVGAAECQYFAHLPDFLKATLLETFRSPTFTSLRFGWINDMPLRYILSCPQLKRLKHIGPYNIDVHNHGEETSPIRPPSTCALDYLELDCDPCARTIIGSSVLDKLRTLRVTFLYSTEIFSLMSQSQRSLRFLDIRACQLPTATDIDLYNLEELCLWTLFEDFEDDPEEAPRFIASLVEVNTTLTTIRPLRKISLTFLGPKLSWRRAFNLLGLNTWTRSDVALSRPCFANFQSLELYLYTNGEDDDKDPFLQLEPQFPRLFHANKLECIWWYQGQGWKLPPIITCQEDYRD